MHYISAWGRHKMALFAALLIIIGILVMVITQRSEPEDMSEDSLVQAEESLDSFATNSFTEAAPPTPAPTDIPTVVYVSGAVQQPEVYALPANARIKDLIVAAGGFTADADPDRINLAQRLNDGQHIYVPRQGETLQAKGTTAPGTDSAISASGSLININTAGAAELEEAPGIGQSTAQRIIEYRTANGPFKSIEDLQNVKGIGPTLIDEITPHVTVGP